MARTIAKDHDKKRAQILRQAARVFATEGFDRASMSQLAEACGISKANIYHYYPSKDALLFDILDTYLRALRDRIMAVDIAAMTPPEALNALVLEILLAYQGADHEHRIQIRRLAILPEGEQKILRAYQRDMVRRMSQVLEMCAPETFAAEPAKLRAAAMSVFGMLNWYYMWNTKADTRARREYARLVTDLTLGGLRAV
ncbi:MAG TPA: TetR/AcrR family transcriptional regulator [Aliiroseovarius sp.]|nr:TetR/AcrR family transcriptional regulator [Aliiroseovarius sp.]